MMQDPLRWRFGPHEFVPAEHLLLCDGLAVAASRKALAVLAALLDREGRIVTKSELFSRAWPGRVVGDAALSRAVHELRRALGDAPSRPRYVATVHGLGFRFVGKVEAQVQPLTDRPAGSITGIGTEPGGVDAAPTAAGEGLLVGRDAERAALEQALTAARDGRRQVVWVTGEAGIGKTALVQDFVQRHRAAVWAVQGRCVESYGASHAYLPILEAFERLAHCVGAETMCAVLGRYAPSWLAMLPWLPAPGAGHGDPAEASPTRLMREGAHALEMLSAQTPIVLWLEDLHWCDPSSLAMLAFIAGRSEPARLLVVGSSRTAEVQAERPLLRQLAAQLARRGQARELQIGPLDRSALADYIGQRLGPLAPATQARAASVWRRTGGHPLFAVALIEDLIRREEPAWEKDDEALPASLRHLLDALFDRLGARDQRVLEAAAAAGHAFDAATVAAALGVDPTQVEERCARMAAKGRFLMPQASRHWADGTVTAGFSFAHVLYRHGALQRVSAAQHAEWQRRMALRQERGHADQCEGIAVELAMRFELGNDVRRCVAYLLLAGKGALSRCAYAECVALLERGLSLLPRLPLELQPRRELDLLLPLGAARMATLGYAAMAVEQTYRRAMTLCATCGRPGEQWRVLRGLWNVVFLRAELQAAHELGDRLLAMAGPDDHAAARFDAHAKLGQTALHQGDLVGARRHLEQAMDIAQVQPDRVIERELPRVAIYLAWVYWYSGDAPHALAMTARTEALALDCDSVHSRAFVLGYGGWVLALCGQREQARQRHEQLNRLSTEHGLAYWHHLACFQAALDDARHSGSDEPFVAMRTAIDSMVADGGRVGVPYLLCLLAEAELNAGQAASARASLDRAVALADGARHLYSAEWQRLNGLCALATSAPRAPRSSPR